MDKDDHCLYNTKCSRLGIQPGGRCDGTCMNFIIEITEEALEDLEYFDKAARVTILDEIERQLVYQPLQETKNRKPLRPSSQFQWELRVGKYRVFYDVMEETGEESLVSVVSVGYKEHNKLYIRGQEVNL